MFKGLRTKIESEQKVQNASGTSDKHLQLSKAPDKPKKTEGLPGIKQIQSDTPSVPTTINSSDGEQGSINQNLPTTGVAKPKNQASQIASILRDESLEERVLRLSDQLKTVMKEKEESNDQNVQLYQLVEKLRRNLENEKETSSSLRFKLNELETKLQDEKDHPRGGYKTTNISMKPFSRQDLPPNDNSIGETNDIDALRHEIIELQAQVAKKNRLLKIKQQNLIDLKKTLQKEMLDHGRTQEELVRLQKQLRDQETFAHPRDGEIHGSRQNGSILNESSDTKNSRDFNQNLNDESQQETGQTATIQYGSGSGGTGIGCEDTISLSAIGGGAQLDHISYLSRSSVSVEDFEQSDTQQSNHNKEVNFEYLKNVLYRYMTSTDTETTQHLVKAISVLMDFSLDQSTAIKSAMNARNSWLRLK